MLGFVEGEVPGVAVDTVPAGARGVGLKAAGAEHDADSFGAEGFDAATEGRAAGLRSEVPWRMGAELERLRAAFPGFSFRICQGWRGPTFEA